MVVEKEKMQQQREWPSQEGEWGTPEREWEEPEEETSSSLVLTRAYCTAQIIASLTIFTYATLQLGTAFVTMMRGSDLLFPLLWFIFLAPSGFIGAIQWRQARRQLAWSGKVTKTPTNALFAATIFAMLASIKAYIYYMMGYTMIPVTLFFYLISLAFLYQHTREVRKKKTS
jgi:hypothetical protein